MKNRVLQLAFALGLTFIIAATLAGAAAPERTALIQRGRYIVENVGMCIDCHSPRDEKGEFIPDRGLTGAPIAFVPHRADAVGARRSPHRRPSDDDERGASNPVSADRPAARWLELTTAHAPVSL